MEEFKIEHFIRLHGIPFPPIRALAPDECERVAALARRKLKLPIGAEPLLIVKTLDSRETEIPGVLATDEGFDVSRFITREHLPNAPVLINWYRFDEIDEVELSVLSTFFSDLWYPGADDIDVFDHEFSWVVSITHSGNVKRVVFVKLES